MGNMSRCTKVYIRGKASKYMIQCFTIVGVSEDQGTFWLMYTSKKLSYIANPVVLKQDIYCIKIESQSYFVLCTSKNHQ